MGYSLSFININNTTKKVHFLDYFLHIASLKWAKNDNDGYPKSIVYITHICNKEMNVPTGFTMGLKVTESQRHGTFATIHLTKAMN